MFSCEPFESSFGFERLADSQTDLVPNEGETRVVIHEDGSSVVSHCIIFLAKG